MKDFKIKLSVEYEVKAEDEENALVKLEEDLGSSNRSAETEFWSNLDVQEDEREHPAIGGYEDGGMAGYIVVEAEKNMNCVRCGKDIIEGIDKVVRIQGTKDNECAKCGRDTLQYEKNSIEDLMDELPDEEDDPNDENDEEL